MALKHRLTKLENASPTNDAGGSVSEIILVAAGGKGCPNGEIDNIENIPLRKKFIRNDDETEGQFLTRYYRGIASSRPALQLSDDELEIVIAGGCEKIAKLLINNEPVPDSLLKTILETNNGA